MTTQPDSVFVGRQRELAQLQGCLEEAVSGRGQIVMLAGEPGIGKTTLAQQVADRAVAAGALVLWGWCYEHAGAPPYWPYVQPIRNYAEHAEAEQLRTEMGMGAADIAGIVPIIGEKLPGLEHVPALLPDQARFRLFDSVTTFLKNASLARPLVMVLDDLHWADGSSLLLLEFLAREIAASPILIMGTYRDDEVTSTHQLSQVLGGLVRSAYFHRVQLSGLTQREVGDFVAAKSGIDVPGYVAATMHRRTEGNPLFVSEVIGLLRPQEITGDLAWADAIPVAVRETTLRRLSRLSDSCNTVLRTASVMGREFEYPLLKELTSNFDDDGLVDALDEALEARLIEALPSGPDHYQFGHALIQEAIYQDISPVRRAREHGRIGEAIERLHQADLEGHAAALAHHFARAGGAESAQKVVKHSLIAGGHALATFGYEQAEVHFQQALDAKGAQEIDSEISAARFRLGRAQAATLPRDRLAEPHLNSGLPLTITRVSRTSNTWWPLPSSLGLLSLSTVQGAATWWPGRCKSHPLIPWKQGGFILITVTPWEWSVGTTKKAKNPSFGP